MTLKMPATPASADAISKVCWELRERLDALRRAGAPDDQVRPLAKAYIESNYAWQTAKYGRIMKRLSVAAILR